MQLFHNIRAVNVNVTQSAVIHQRTGPGHFQQGFENGLVSITK
jgi:hypothetical protein